MAEDKWLIREMNDDQQLLQMLQRTDDSELKQIIRERLRILCEQRLVQGQGQSDSSVPGHLQNDVTENAQGSSNDVNTPFCTANSDAVANSNGGGSGGKEAVEEEAVARTTRTEKTSDGGRTTTTTTTTTHKTKDGNRLTTKQTRQITRVGAVGCTNYPLSKVPAEEVLQCLLSTFQVKPVAGLTGLISVKTESWNSKDGVVVRSHKSHALGDGDVIEASSGQSRDRRTSPDSAELRPTLYSPAQCDLRPERITVQRGATSIKQVLLDWCKTRVRGYQGVDVTDFSSSWTDGLAFCALVHSYYPDAFDFDQLSASDRRHNFQLAFDTAQSRAGIAPLLNVEDMLATSSPDWRSVFTYLQSIYRRLAAITRPRPSADDVTLSPQ